MSKMIGVIKISPTNIVSRCGFKYLVLDPPLTLLAEANTIRYKDRSYEFDTMNKITIEIDEQDIIDEAMARFTVKDCNFLNKTAISGCCTLNSGFRQIVFSDKFVLCPIGNRKSHGQFTDRHDTFLYSEFDYIKFLTSWEQSGKKIERSIQTSISNYSDIDLWARLELEHPSLHMFLRPPVKINEKQLLSSNLPFPMINQNDVNEKHLSRFFSKYGTSLMFGNNIRRSDYSFMDVIDIGSINEIQITEPEILKTCPSFEIKAASLLKRGEGFDPLMFNKDDISARKYFYLLVKDCIQHRIYSSDSSKVLCIEINANPNVKKEFLLIKFNKDSIDKFNTNLIIEKLKM